MRTVARAFGVTFVAAWAFILLVGTATEGFASVGSEGSILTFLVLVASLGVALCFTHETAGGLLTFSAGLALAVFALVTAGRNQWIAVIVAGVPFIAAGSLILIAARRDAPGSSTTKRKEIG
jgi:hypothetical protein